MKKRAYGGWNTNMQTGLDSLIGRSFLTGHGERDQGDRDGIDLAGTQEHPRLRIQGNDAKSIFGSMPITGWIGALP